MKTVADVSIVYSEYRRDICMGKWMCMQISSQT